MLKQIIFIFIASFGVFFYSSAQLSFVRDQTVQVIDDSLPLKNAWAGGLNYPMFWPIDLNGDNIMDLVAFDPGPVPGHNRLMPFINHGDSGKVDYHYAPEYISRFPDIYAWLVVYDYNCDGKNDLFCLSKDCSCGIMVYRNDYTSADGLRFTKIENAQGTDYLIANYNGTLDTNIPAGSATFPAILDVDGDGAMDIVGWPSGVSSTFAYYRGLSVDNHESCDSLHFKWITDCWGHFSLTQGANLATLGLNCREAQPDSALIWNTGTAVLDDTQSCICIYKQDDIISSRNKDVLIGGYADNNMLYLHNGGTASNDNMDFEDYNWPIYNAPVNLPSFPCAYNLDVDNDTRKDMIVAPHIPGDYRGIQYYKNTDISRDTGRFTLQPHTFLQQEMIEVGTAAAPQIFDYDCDGLPDMLIGDQSYLDTTQKKGIALYKNIGTSSMPKFKLMTRDFAGLNELNGLNGTFCPTFGDLNKDGFTDMILGSADGQLYYFKNTGCPANFIPPSGPYMGIDAGSFSSPQLYDLNHDGKLDLIVGNSFGFIKYFENIGTDTNPLFSSSPTKDTLGGIMTSLPSYTSGFASPVFYNDSGVDKLIVGTFSGKVYVYDSIMGNIFGSYHLTDSLINGEEGQNLIPAIGDLNNDGYPDMLIGNTNGGVSLYMNRFGINGINELHKTVHPSFYVYPNPVSDELYVDFYNTERKNSAFEIVNNIGQIVYRQTVTGPKMELSLKRFANGIYLARFVNSDNVQSLKIVINH